MELNFGIKGFALFLWSHRRNDIDAQLKGQSGVLEVRDYLIMTRGNMVLRHK